MLELYNADPGIVWAQKRLVRSVVEKDVSNQEEPWNT